jgi:hypothetical protein
VAVVAGGAVPRRVCPQCDREIAIPGGRFARHDPPERGPALLSCPGSLSPAPLSAPRFVPAGAVPLFEFVDAGPAELAVPFDVDGDAG